MRSSANSSDASPDNCANDTLVVWRLDRLGRDARSACVVVEALRERGWHYGV